MNEDFNSIIDQYRADGRDDGYIARKIFLSGDYNGEFNDLVNMVSSYKKKDPAEQEPTQEAPQEQIPTVTMGSVLERTPSESTPQDKTPDTETVGSKINKINTIDELGKEFQGRFYDDKISTIDSLINSDEQFGAKVNEIESSDKTDEQKRYAVQTAFSERFYEKEREIREGYTEELKSRLPEGTDLEEAADILYNNYGVGVPLDGDRRYNEGNVLVRHFTDPIVDFGAQTASLAVSGLTALMGLDPTPGISRGYKMSVADQVKKYAQDGIDEFQREYTTQYDQSFTESLDPRETYSSGGESLSRAIRGVGQSLPYILTASIGGAGSLLGAVITGAVATTDSYMRSRSDDLTRKTKGLDPMYDSSPSGEIARAGGAAIDGVLTGAAGKVQAAILKRAISNPATNQTAVQAFKGYLKAQGIDMGTEGVVEGIQQISNMGYQDLVAGQYYSADEYIKRGVEAVLLGASSSGVIAGGGAIPRGLRAGSEIISRPQAAVNSRVEKAGQDPNIENLNASQDVSGLVSGFEQGKRAEKEQNQKFYTMMAARHPVDMDRISQLDLALEQAVIEYKRVQEADGDLTNNTKQINSIVSQRQAIVESHSGESVELTSEENRFVEDGRIANALNGLDADVAVLSESVEVQGEAMGTEGFDQGAYEDVVGDLEVAKDRKKQALRLLGELGAARRATEDAVASASTEAASGLAEVEQASQREFEAEQALRVLLDMDVKPMQAESDVEQTQEYSAAKQIENHFEDQENKGSTFTLDGRNMAGQDKVSVSIFPDRSKIVEGDVTKEDLEAYVEDNKDALEDNKDVLSVGTWFDSESNQTYIDIAATLDRDVAVELGKQYNQKAVWDLKTNEEIDTGGSGEVEGDLKPLADRITDIRNLVAPKEAAQEPVSETAQEPSNIRGIEGQFAEYTPQKDGSMGVLAKGAMKAADAKFVNTKVAETLKAASNGNYKVVVHDTAQSGDLANPNSPSERLAHAVINPDGSIEVHLNPSRFAEAKAQGKDSRAVIVEEVFHATLSPALSKLYKGDRKVLDKLLGEMEGLARGTGNADLIARVEAKKKAYQDAGAGEAEVIDEALAEFVSEMVVHDYDKSVMDKIRVVLNKIMRAAVGKNAITINSLDSARNIVDAFSAMVKDGTAVKVADGVVEETMERSAISPSKLPENESFTMTWWQPRYYKKGDLVGLKGESSIQSQDFNGKWHFINWWKQATRMGQLEFSDFRATIDGKEVEVNANIMRRWKMKPYVNKRKAIDQAEKTKRMMVRELVMFVNDGRKAEREKQPRYGGRDIRKMSVQEFNKLSRQEMNIGNVGYSYRDMVDELMGVFNDEQIFEATQILEGVRDGRPYEHTSEYQRVLEEVATPQNIAKLFDVFEDRYQKESSIDPIERSAVSTQYLVMENEGLQGGLEQRQKEKTEAICGIGGKTCATNDKVSLLQYESHLVKSQIGDNPSVRESTDYASKSLQVADNHLRRFGFDINKILDNYSEGKEVFYTRLMEDPDITLDPREYDWVYDVILSYTSNGAKIDPNVNLANNIFRSGLIALQTNSTDFIPQSRIDGIANKEEAFTVGSVAGQRASNISRHLADINKLFKTYGTDGARFLKDMKKRDKNGVPALASAIGVNTEKLADLALGNMGDSDAIPLDSNVRDQINIYRGRFDDVDYSEGLVIPEEVRSSVVSRMKTLGRDVNIGMSDAEIFADIREMKSSGDDFTTARAKEFYNALVGNNLTELRDFSADQKREARGMVTAIAKKMGLTPFQVQQLMYMDGIHSWNLYRGDFFVSDYKSAQERNLGMELTQPIERSAMYTPGTQLDLFAQEVPAEAERFPIKGRRLVSHSMKSGDAFNSQLYRQRDVETGIKVRVRGQEVALTQKAVDEALSTDATSRRIIGKNSQITEGQRVGVRLNLNVMKNTGVPVQTMHDKTASGEALKYAPAVTVKNADLFVNQNARNKIVTFQENKFPMASVNGEFVASGTDLDYSGVKAVFNPFRHNVFVDMAGRPIKSAGEATIIGGNVYLRGNIEYYDLADPILESGRGETEEQRSKRTKRGPKYDKAIKRFIGYSKSQGIEYASQSEAEAAYDNMTIPSEVALSESEIAGNMAEAIERSAISGFYKKGKKMRQNAAKAARKYTEVRADIINNPDNYIVPQKLSEIKDRLQDLTDQDLVDVMTDEAVGRLSQRNDDIGVLAGSEMIRRAVARGETERIPAIIAELAAIGTTAGRILRHFRELKSSTPAGLAATIKSSVEAAGNKLSDQQESELNQLTMDLYQQQAIVEDLMRRAVGGEEVDAELSRAVEVLKASERKMDTFTNKYVERGFGDLFGMLVQGNLLTPMSQALNVAANSANLIGGVLVDAVSIPTEAAYVAIGNALGKNLETRRRPSLMAYAYAMRKFGEGFVESADQFVTGQDKEISEWRVNRGMAPFRSMMAALKNDLPMGIDGKASMSQRAKLFTQGTLGVPAETMFRLLSFGDIPFRRYAEAKYLYQSGLNQGLEGEALARFLKYPTKEQLSKAKVEGRKLTFQEETIASKAVNQIITSFENVTAQALDNIPGMNGRAFSKAFFKTLIPFRSTPANILLETFTWVSPYVGITRMASDLNKGDTEEASKTLSKMMIGAVTMEAAMLMIKEGIISGAIQWNEDEEKNIAYDVFPPSSINVSALERLIKGGDPAKRKNDRFVKYDKLGLIGAVFATAVQSVDMTDAADIKAEEYDGPIDFFTDAITNFFGLSSFAAISTMMEQSFVQGLNGLLKVLTGDDVERNMEGLIVTLFQAGSAAALPNTMSALYRAEREFLPDVRVTKDMDTMERILKKFEYTIKDRTFGLADHPVRYNWKGDPIRQTPRGTTPIAYQLFDITKSRQGTADPLSNEIWRLYEQTEDLSDVCGTPSYAAKRSLSVPDIKSSKELRAARRLGKKYTWMDDQDFMKERVYMSVDQINRMMQAAGKARYQDAFDLIQTTKYRNATDEAKVELLNEVADKYASSKAYDGNRFMPHTVALFDILQEIYDGR